MNRPDLEFSGRESAIPKVCVEKIAERVYKRRKFLFQNRKTLEFHPKNTTEGNKRRIAKFPRYYWNKYS